MLYQHDEVSFIPALI